MNVAGADWAGVGQFVRRRAFGTVLVMPAGRRDGPIRDAQQEQGSRRLLDS